MAITSSGSAHPAGRLSPCVETRAARRRGSRCPRTALPELESPRSFLGLIGVRLSYVLLLQTLNQAAKQRRILAVMSACSHLHTPASLNARTFSLRVCIRN